MLMSTVRKRGRSARAISPGTLTAFRALPAERRQRVRALVYRRGYSVQRAMDIPPDYLMSHILFGYSYRRPWKPLKSLVVVVVIVLVVFAVFSTFWGL